LKPEKAKIVASCVPLVALSELHLFKFLILLFLPPVAHPRMEPKMFMNRR